MSVKNITAKMIIILFFLIPAGFTPADDFRWDGDSLFNNWNLDQNWYNMTSNTDNDGYPDGNNDTAVITTPDSINVNINITIGELSVNNNNLTITMNADLTIDDAGGESGIFTLSNGTLEVNGYTLTVNQDLVISGFGTLRANGTSNVTVVDNFIVNGGAVELGTGTFIVGDMLVSGGSFTQTGNNGLNIQSTGSLTVSGGTGCSWDSGTLILAGLISHTNGSLAFGTKIVTGVTTFNVDNPDGDCNLGGSTITASDDVTISTTGAGALQNGTSWLIMNGGDLSTDSNLTNLRITDDCFLGSAITFDGDLQINAGTLDAQERDILIAGNFTNSSTYTHNDNTVIFTGGAVQTFDSGGNPFYSITVDKSANNLQVQDNEIIQSAGGVLTMTNGGIDLNGSSWTLGADFAINNTNNPVFDLNNGTLTDGSGPQTYDVIITDGTLRADGTSNVTVEDFTVNGGTVELGNGTFTVGDMLVSGGSFTQTGNNGLNTQSTGSLTVSGGTGCSWDSGTLILAGLISHTNGSLALGTKIVTGVTTFDVDNPDGDCNLGGSTITASDNVTISTTGAGALQNGTSWLIMNGGDLSTDSNLTNLRITDDCFLGSAITLDGDLQINAGTLDAQGRDIIIAGNFTNSSTYTHNDNTVIFNNADEDQTIDPGASPFFNLTKQGETRLTIVNNTLTVVSTLRIDADDDIVDMEAIDFNINILENNGLFELDGTQDQSINEPDVDSGRTDYNGATGGNVHITDFYNLYFNQPWQTFMLNNDINVDGSLTINGNTTLDVSTNNCTIDVAQDWNLNAGAVFIPRYGNVIIDSDIDTVIRGSNTFHNLTCEIPGKNIYFQAGETTTIDLGGTLHLIGADSNYIVLNSDNPGTHWLITMTPGATMDMCYVNVYWSEGTPYRIPIPDDVNDDLDLIYNCINWIRMLRVIDSYVLDQDPKNGKVDTIRVQAETSIGNDFTGGFTAIVPGYTVSGYSRPYVGDEFYIHLTEGSELDTDATPLWWIDSNPNLYDSASGTYLVLSNEPPPPFGIGTGETPIDASAPVIGYTLAVADKDEVFVCFSEPVYQPGGGEINADNFTYDGTTTVESLLPVISSGNGREEILLGLSTSISASEIVLPGNISIQNTVLRDVVDMAGQEISIGTTHRVSDIGLGLVGDGIIELVWAADETEQNTIIEGVGMIRNFDGSAWLQDQVITIQTHIHNDITSNPDIILYYDINVLSTYITNDFWIPPFATAAYNGIVPYANPSSRSIDDPIIISTQLRNYTLLPDDLEIQDNAEIEIIFELIGMNGNLYCARLTSDTANDWYRGVRPWSFGIHDIIKQTGDVTILNNVINPNRGEITNLHYELTRSGSVTIRVIDLKGDIVDVIYSGYQSSGEHNVSWDGRNRGNRIVARGVYFIKILAPDINEIRKVLVVK